MIGIEYRHRFVQKKHCIYSNLRLFKSYCQSLLVCPLCFPWNHVDIFGPQRINPADSGDLYFSSSAFISSNFLLVQWTGKHRWCKQNLQQCVPFSDSPWLYLTWMKQNLYLTSLATPAFIPLFLAKMAPMKKVMLTAKWTLHSWHYLQPQLFFVFVLITLKSGSE